MIDPQNIIFYGLFGLLIMIPIVVVISQRDAIFNNKSQKESMK